ncbi:hypothetical protein EJ02DRAFT_351419, partial [Clathrospora elynae]
IMLPPNIAAVLSGAWQMLNTTSTYLNGTLTTTATPGDLGLYPIGFLIYHSSGFMSANMASTTPGDIPLPAKNYTDAEYSLMARHTLSYAGGLSVWEGSNETMGTVTHGPLTMATRPDWEVVNQTRNYTVSIGYYEGRDVLHLWARNEEKYSISNIYWARAGGWSMRSW